MSGRRFRAVALGIIVLAMLVPLGGCRSEGGDTDAPAGGAADATAMSLSSEAFADGDQIPVEHAREGVEGGRNVSVPLAWAEAPEEVASFALLIIDVHPIARKWVHWAVVDIPGDVTGLPAGASGTAMPAGARELANGFGDTGYGGPEPPAGTGAHRYVATVYALDVETVEVAEDAGLAGFLQAVTPHVLAQAELTGSFGR